MMVSNFQEVKTTSIEDMAPVMKMSEYNDQVKGKDEFKLDLNAMNKVKLN
jgi:hypothetical protein